MLRWLSDRVEGYHNPRNVILFTARTLDWQVVAERDLAEYRFAATIVNRLELDLVDWIETDGEIVRSYAYLANPNTRLGQPGSGRRGRRRRRVVTEPPEVGKSERTRFSLVLSA